MKFEEFTSELPRDIVIALGVHLPPQVDLQGYLQSVFHSSEGDMEVAQKHIQTDLSLTGWEGLSAESHKGYNGW